jgi:hypothetical protein
MPWASEIGDADTRVSYFGGLASQSMVPEGQPSFSC